MSDIPTATTTAAGDPTGAGSSQAIYRRFRAQTFAQIVGQDAVVQTLRNAVRLERLGHAFLFVGPRGTGKTSMARILAKAVNCTDLRDGEPCDRCPSCAAIREGRALDVIELDAASNNKVDDMRELVPRVYTGAADLKRKVFIIDEVQRIKEGWDVLLKTLEEPPDGVLFIFCTTDPSQIRPAVVSRLQRFTFRPLAVPEIEGKLQRILEAEGREVEPEALALVATLAGGGMRDAESMLDQVLVSAADPITAAAVRDLLGLADSEAVDRFIDALVGGDVLGGVDVLDGLEAEGRDLVAFSEQLVTRLRAALVARLTARTAEERASARPLARAARRLTGIDASRSGLGGYRWQLELCLLQAADEVVAGVAVSQPVLPGVAGSSPVVPGATRPAAAASRFATVTDLPSGSTGGDGSSTNATPVAGERRPSQSEGPRAPSTAPAGSVVGPGAPSIDVVTAAPAPPSDPVGDDVPATAAKGSRRASAGTAPTRTPEPATRARAPSQAADVEISAIRDAWPGIVAAIGSNPANRPLVTNCRPVEFRDGFLVLGFPEDQAFLRDIAERKRTILEDGIASVVGRPVAVRCVVTNLELVEPVDSGEGDLLAQARRIFDEELAGVEDVD